MISFAEALRTALNTGFRTDVEAVRRTEALGRVLAERVTSDGDVPPWDASAMDGFACRAEDTERPMRVRAILAAGDVPTESVCPGECMRIMTGAMLPQGANCVVKVEDTNERDGFVEVVTHREADNIRRRGHEIKRGQVIAEAGERITSAHIAVLAGAGRCEVQVGRRPKVGVLATGSEIVEPDEPVGLGKIRNSNGSQIMAQLRATGAEATYYGIVRDDRERLFACMTEAKANNDVVIVSGGVSEGDFDFVPETFERCGFRALFDSVAMQPGRPTVFARDGNQWAWGLPGNPASTFVVFELLIAPFLRIAMGETYRPRVVRAKLAAPLTRRNAERQLALPVHLREPGIATPVAYAGSAHILAFSHADALVLMPAGTTRLEAHAETDCLIIETLT